PQGLQGTVRIQREGAPSHAPELPSAAFKHSLPCHVLFVPLRAVPTIPVTLNRHTTFHPIDHKVNSISCDLVLGQNAKPPTGDSKEYVEFEPTLKRFWRRDSVPICSGCEVL